MPSELFGNAYLDAESFRKNATLFGVGMAFCDFPDDDEGNEKLLNVLQAASRMIDSEAGKDFTPGNRSEQHLFDFAKRQIKVNNPPVSEIISVNIIFSPGASQVFTPQDCYINNQLSYIEITDLAIGLGVITNYLNLGLSDPVAEIVYKSAQDVPKHVALATGYQAAKMINEGFVDTQLPPNFGQIDMGGLTINNKKGYRLKAEDVNATVIDPMAKKLLNSDKTITVR